MPILSFGCKQKLLNASTLHELASLSDTNKPFWNNSCTKLAKKLYIPNLNNVSTTITQIPNFIQNNKVSSTCYTIDDNKNVKYESIGFKPLIKANKDKMITRKIRIKLTDNMKQILKPMFICTRYHYDKTVKYLIDNYFELNLKNTFLAFLHDKFKLKISANFTFKPNVMQKIASKITLLDRINVKYKYIKYLFDKYANLPTKTTIRDCNRSTKMNSSHIEYWTKDTPAHAKGEACFNAYVNYKTTLINYICRVIIKFLNCVRNNTVKDFKLLEFNLKPSTIDSVAIDKHALNFDKNTFFPRRMKNMYYTVNKKDKTRCMKLINYNLSNISDSKLIYNNGYFLCLSLNIKSTYKDKKYNTVALDPGVRTFQTIYSPDGISAKLGDGYNKVLYNKMTNIDYCNSLLDDKKLSKRKLKRIRKRINKKWTKMKNIVDELHKTTANYLVNNFHNIIVPETNISDMVKKFDRNIGKSTVRSLLQLAHYKFRERLVQLADRKSVNITLTSEAYTSKTCGQCGYIDQSLGSKKTYLCSCSYTCDRDLHGARNIYIRTINGADNS